MVEYWKRNPITYRLSTDGRFLRYRGEIIGYGDPELIVRFIPYSHRIYEQINYGLAELFVIDIPFTELL